ncbi:uncharacterized protein LOC127731116 [Mytilus californianus]|uniref:uncharacterized protein LOC127731116 n=1 Tax=Mytilus californianus TaxID=6549 RepID=UPI002247DB2C|nr:uncharacterized protein LOC127731116 [Mytilus californianus]
MNGLCCLLFLTLFVSISCVTGNTERSSQSGIITSDDEDKTDSVDKPSDQQNKQLSKELSDQKCNLTEPALTSNKKQQQPKQTPSTGQEIHLHESVRSSEKKNRLSEPALSSTHRNQKIKSLPSFKQNDKVSDSSTSPSDKRDQQTEPEKEQSSSGKNTKLTEPPWSSKKKNNPTSFTGFASNPGMP